MNEVATNKIILEKNNKIKFNEKTHQYYVDCSELISVSKTIHQFFPKFVKNKIAKGCPAKTKAILSDWKVRNLSGTAVHKFLEDYVTSNLDPTDDEFQKKAKKIGTTLDNLKLRFIAGKQFIEDTKSKGWKLFMAEWIIWSEDLGLAGTIDLLFINDKNEIFIIDYKCVKGIYKQTFPKHKLIGYDEFGIPKFKYESEKGFYPIEHLNNCNFIIYSLQLTAYKYILEKEYGLKVVGTTLVQLPQDCSEYVSIPTLYLKEEFKTLITNKI